MSKNLAHCESHVNDWLVSRWDESERWGGFELAVNVSHCPRCLRKRFILQVLVFLEDDDDDDDVDDDDLQVVRRMMMVVKQEDDT